jgi:hypothetical protein
MPVSPVGQHPYTEHHITHTTHKMNSQMLTSAKMLLNYLTNGNLCDAHLQMLTDADYKMYMRVINAENDQDQIDRASYLEFYAEQVIANLESEDEPEPVKPVKTQEKKTIPLAKQSTHQKAWGAWTKKMASERKDDIQAYKMSLIAEGKSATAPHLKWISAFANAKSAPYQEFLAQFK